MPPSLLVLFAQYNQQMNRRLYDCVTAMPAEQVMADQGAFFGSIFNTLNHILVGDIIWLNRFSQHPAGFAALSTFSTPANINQWPKPTSLDAILFDDLVSLTKARHNMDAILLAFTEQLTVEHLASSLTYRNTKGDTFTKPFGPLVLHLFNHQTHHRGQVSTLINQAGVDLGMTDMLMSIA